MPPLAEALIEGALSLLPLTLCYKMLFRKKRGFDDEYLDQAGAGCMVIVGLLGVIATAIRLVWRIWHG